LYPGPSGEDAEPLANLAMSDLFRAKPWFGASAKFFALGPTDPVRQGPNSNFPDCLI